MTPDDEEGYGEPLRLVRPEAPGKQKERSTSLEVAAAVIEALDVASLGKVGTDGLVADIRGAHGAYKLFVLEHLHYIHCDFNYSFRVPEARRADVAVTLCRANMKVLHGNFDLDMDQGYLRYRLATDVEGATLAPGIFENMFDYGLAMAEAFHDAIASVAFGDADPADAIATVPWEDD